MVRCEGFIGEAAKCHQLNVDPLLLREPTMAATAKSAKGPLTVGTWCMTFLVPGYCRNMAAQRDW